MYIDDVSRESIARQANRHGRIAESLGLLSEFEDRFWNNPIVSVETIEIDGTVEVHWEDGRVETLGKRTSKRA